MFAELSSLISGVKQGAGFTRFVEFMPNKKDSVSAAFDDNFVHGICAGNKPRPGSSV
jgi:hypothetical protein